MNDPFQISVDPIWHRWVDGLVILMIGLFAGIVLSQSIAFFQLEAVTPAKAVKVIPLAPTDTEAGNGHVDAPQNTIRIEEV